MWHKGLISRGRGTDHMTSDLEASREDKGKVTREECVLCKQVSPLQENVSWRLFNNSMRIPVHTVVSYFKNIKQASLKEQMVLKYDTDS